MSAWRTLVPVLAVVMLGCGRAFVQQGRVELTNAGDPSGILVRAAGERASTLTDSAGHFVLNTATEHPEIVVSGPGLDPPERVQSSDGSELVFSFTAVGTVRGTVTLEGGGEVPALVSVSSVDGASSVQVEATGRWMLTNVPIGTQAVLASASEFAIEVSTPFDVAQGQVTEVEPLVLRRANGGETAVLGGRVEMADGRPEGVRVTVVDTGQSTLTTDGGVFELGGVPEGLHALRLQRDRVSVELPGVLAVRGVNGLVLDESLYLLDAKPIPFADAHLLSRGPIDTLRAQLDSALWIRSEASKSLLHGLLPGNRVARTIGQLVDTSAFALSNESKTVVWVSQTGLEATELATGSSRSIVRGDVANPTVSDFGDLVYETFDQTNRHLWRTSLSGGEPEQLHTWPRTLGVSRNRFADRALLHWTSISQDQGVLWWRLGSQRADFVTPSEAFIQWRPRAAYFAWNSLQGWLVLHFPTGTTRSVLGGGALSEDGEWLAVPSSNHSMVMRIETGEFRLLGHTGYPVCVSEGSVFFGASPWVLDTPQRVLTLESVPGTATFRCTGGSLFLSEQSQSFALRLSLADGLPLPWGAEGIRPSSAGVVFDATNDRIWFRADGVASGPNEVWIQNASTGEARLVSKGASGGPDASRVAKISPDGRWAAFLGRDGLTVARAADGSDAKPIATRVERYEWISSTELVFVREQFAAPFRSLAGVYVWSASGE